jgi:hypothetical protein
MVLVTMRNIILLVGWPILIIGSLYIFVKGRAVYKLVRGSLVGRVTQVLVITMLVEMYSLGIACTAYMFERSEAVYIVLPIFLVWLAMFIWVLRTLDKAREEANKIAKQK